MRSRGGRSHYARDHLTDVPGLVAARIGRSFGVYALDQELTFDRNEGRDKGTQRAGQILHLLLLPFVVFGAVRLTRRYLPVLLAGPLVVVVSASVFYGSTRMRVSAEPALVVLAAVGIVALADIVRRRRATQVSDEPGPDDDTATGDASPVPPAARRSPPSPDASGARGDGTLRRTWLTIVCFHARHDRSRSSPRSPCSPRPR